MAFSVQNNLGTVSDANAYIEVAFFKEYHDNRGNDYSSFNDTQIQNAIVKATDFVDVRFDYFGIELEEGQPTEWPRNIADGIPKCIKEATAEYALRALSAELLSDPDVTVNGRVVETTEKIGPITESTKFDENGGDYLIPPYPLADRKIEKSGFVYSGSVGTLVR